MTRPFLPVSWRLRTRSVSNVHHTLIMGILNVTPDSFSDGGWYLDHDDAVAHGLSMAAAGADIVDVGGESTRPGSAGVDADEELCRVVPVVRRLAEEGLVVSVDTTKPAVAAAALEAGAEIVNDVTGMRDPEMTRVVAASGAGAVLMHMRGLPATMQEDVRFGDVVVEVRKELATAVSAAVEAGIAADRLCVDPGIGFGKHMPHNLALLSQLDRFVDLGPPVMVGTSRKSFLGTLTGIEAPEDRDVSTAVSTALAIARGATVVRVHNVAMTAEAVAVTDAIVRARSTESEAGW